MKRLQRDRFLQLMQQLAPHGLDAEDALVLVRCERSLTKWATIICGDGNWIVEREILPDGSMGRPMRRWVGDPTSFDNSRRFPVRDQEKAALTLARDIAARANLDIRSSLDPRASCLRLVRDGAEPVDIPISID